MEYNILTEDELRIINNIINSFINVIETNDKLIRESIDQHNWGANEVDSQAENVLYSQKLHRIKTYIKMIYFYQPNTPEYRLAITHLRKYIMLEKFRRESRDREEELEKVLDRLITK